MTQPTIGQNMLLFTTFFGEQTTFKMMPVTQDCPFLEVIYDRATMLLVVINKTTKHNYQMMPSLNDKGDMIRVSSPRENGKTYKEVRELIPICQEYYIIDQEEQKAFVKLFAQNAESFPLDTFFRSLEEESKISKTAPAVLIDKDGMPLK
jgi:hypothetical protein